MIKVVNITSNNFITIFTDAITLYEMSLEASNINHKNTLAKSSILSTNYALEAAANSFLATIRLDEAELKTKDRLPTLDKFDFVLQSHQDRIIPRGDKICQDIRMLIRNRDEMVHPKVTSEITTVETTAGDTKISYFHNEIKVPSKIQKKQTKLLDSHFSTFTHADAKQALNIFTAFLNAYVLDWWQLGKSTSAFFLLRSWDGSINSEPYMMEFHEIDLLDKYTDELNIQFIDISSFVKQRQHL
ncbi:hypothetical protein [Pseudomonas violetae]|uniref:Uncharacterized protein n=1 Tax=Pseudomonas violetae TaxID=2915813 RepID=A0ABT0EV88_9PSED|nr:hypothetical protein [Pseudomonas violetae]MCK1789661.1 hypothetical protein [Pseudomonas violetae]